MRSYDEFVKAASISASNLKSWGSDKDKNILYVTGYSGSGKSTFARNVSKGKANVIHLDPYFEKMDKNVASSIRDSEFDARLKKNFPDYDEIANPKTMKRHSKEWWQKVDKLMAETEGFARDQHQKGKKVIVEGVQLNDDTAYPDKTFFKDKPIAVMNTGAFRSYLRGARRDGKNIFKRGGDLKEHIKWFNNTRKNLKKLKSTVGAKRTFKKVEA